MNSFVKYKELLKPSYIPKEINIPKKFINKRFLVNILKEMIRIREVEYFLAEKKRDGHIIGPVHLGVGQEAIPVTLSAFLDRSDQVFGAHRSHGHLLALGGDEYKLFSEVLGRESGFSKGMGGSMHLIDKENGFYGSVPIVSGTVSLALGSALANKIQKNNQLSIAYLGDGAVEEGVVHECLNFASVHEVPIVFVVENNLFSSHMHINERQPNQFTARFAEANHIFYKVSDGNNVIDLLKSSKNLIEYTRKNQKPAFLEAITFRWLGHVDWREDVDVGVNRSKKDIALWKRRDPIKLFKNALIKKKIVSEKTILNFYENLNKNLNQKWEKALQDKQPNTKDILSNIYHE